MTPRDKAIELRNWYCETFGLDHIDGCRAAIKLTDEVISVASTKDGPPGSKQPNIQSWWWKQVKQHLELYNDL